MANFDLIKDAIKGIEAGQSISSAAKRHGINKGFLSAALAGWIAAKSEGFLPVKRGLNEDLRLLIIVSPYAFILGAGIAFLFLG